MTDDPRIAVVGLGYVGLPLAVALARSFDVVGFDTDPARVAELRAGVDRTDSVGAGAVAASPAAFSCEPAEIAGRDLFIVAVPTPLTPDRRPDLRALEAASLTVGGALGAGAVVVYESTVYPGVTETVCGPALESASGLACGRDFFLGYSPERVNPGDPEHTIDRIDKVVAGQTPEVVELMSRVYGAVTSGDVFRAADIRTAEAAKAIENAQRDINIAFMNEVAVIMERLGISTRRVLEAASTKWNFLDFRPGLVGGHCIGVDPHYLAHAALSVGHRPEIILAGRTVNEAMGARVAGRIADALGRAGAAGPASPGSGAGARVLVLGLAFKENVPDLRNTGAADVVGGLRARGLEVDVHDAHADPGEARRLHGIDLVAGLSGLAPYRCVVGAVAHDAYRRLRADELSALVARGGLVADVQGMWAGLGLRDDIARWEI